MSALTTPKDTLLKASKLLRKHRISNNLTQVELAHRSGISFAVLKKYEQTGKISLESLVKLLFVLGLTEAFLKALQPQTKFNSMDELLAANKREKPYSKTAPRSRKKRNPHG